MRYVLCICLFILGYIFVPVELDENDQLDSVTKILDRNGHVIRTLRNNNFEISRGVSLKDVPNDFIKLVLLAEDRRFNSHLGFDTSSFIRALYQNLINGRIVSGASTIDQQLVRLIFKYPRKWYYKPVVMLKAISLNLYNDKDHILEAYLNRLPFGHNIVGLWEASNYFFGKEPQNLALSEMATLAILPRSPSMLIKSKRLLTKKRNALLKEYLPKDKLEFVLNEIPDFHFIKYPSYSPHFVNYLLKSCATDCYSNDEINTSLDLPLQRDLQKIVKDSVQNLSDKYISAASVLVVENKTGQVLSYIGSHDFYDDQGGGQNDGVLQKRQPGSTLKPFTYAYAFMNDHHPSSILADIERNFNVGGGIYVPRNYSNQYMGPVRASFALANSLNIPALELAEYYGVDQILDVYHSVGLRLPNEADYYGVGITLGNGEVSLYELTRAYATLANGGMYRDLTIFKKDNSEVRASALDNDSINLISSILADDYRREYAFGRNSSIDFPFRFSSKTGTSTNFRDNWVVGYNDDFTVGVWAGNFNNESMHNVSGISGAGEIYNQVVRTVYKNRLTYKKPIAKDLKFNKVKICKLSGLKANHDCPNTIVENYGHKHIPSTTCNIHKRIEVYSCHKRGEVEKVNVIDTRDYLNFWSEYTSIPSLTDQVDEKCIGDYKILSDEMPDKLITKVVSPVEGAFYAIDPIIEREYQKLPFEIMTNEAIKSVRWSIDNISVVKKDKDLSYNWKLRKGPKSLNVEILLKNGSIKKESIKFHVL